MESTSLYGASELAKPRVAARAAAALVMTLAAIVVVGAAAFGVRMVYRRAAAHHDALLALTRVDLSANQARATAWILAEEPPAEPAAALTAQRELELIARLRQFAAARNDDLGLHLLAYADALQAELSAAESTGGDSAATQTLAAQRELAFARFQASISAAAEHHAAEVRRADDYAEAGSAMTMAVAAICVGTLAWRYTRARRDAEERALRLSEARFRNLVSDAADVIAVVDAGLTMTYLSPAVTRVTGFRLSHLLGREIVELFEEVERPTLRARLRALAASDNMRISAEAVILSRDGTPRYGEISASNLLHDPSIRGLVLNIRDITERKELEERLRRQAQHDALTGLANRDLFVRTVEGSLSQRSGADGHIAVLFVDLDNFKAVNDTLGHTAGDELLIAVARRLETCVRSRDMVARLGGDEFAVLLRDVGASDDVERQAQRILDVLRSPVASGGGAVHARASIGIAVDGPGAENVGALLRRADVAMYAAKRAGGCRYTLFNHTHEDVMATPPPVDLREAS